MDTICCKYSAARHKAGICSVSIRIGTRYAFSDWCGLNKGHTIVLGPRYAFAVAPHAFYSI